VLGFYAARALDVPGRFRMVPAMANNEPAFAVYQRERDGVYRADAVTVPTLTTTGIARIVTFRNPGLFALFGLPMAHGAGAAGTTAGLPRESLGPAAGPGQTVPGAE
jgi:RNA polymerase sigma-70 factor, ECF subfamily